MGQDGKEAHSPPDGLSPALQLLLQKGPYLNGHAESLGQLQADAVADLSSRLDEVCQAFRRMLLQPDAALATTAAVHLWTALDLAGESRVLRELSSALLSVGKALNNAELQLHAKLGLLRALLQLGNVLEAHELGIEAAQEAQQMQQPELHAQALRGVANCFNNSGDTVQGRLVLLQSLQLSEHSGDRHGMATSYNLLGSLDFEQGNYSDAREHLQRAAALQRELGCLVSESRTLSNLAMLEVRSGNLAAAEELYRRSLQLKTQLNDRRGETICLANLGGIATERNELGKARELYTSALELATGLGNMKLQATLLTNLGMLARDEDDYVLAATRLTQALELHRDSGNRLGEGTTLRFMAMLSYLEDDFRQSAIYLVESLEIHRDYGANRELALAAGLAGTLLARQGDLARGAILLQAAQQQELQHRYGYENDIRSILADGHAAIRTGALNGDWPSVRLEQALAKGTSLSGSELAQYTVSALRERFCYHDTTERSAA